MNSNPIMNSKQDIKTLVIKIGSSILSSGSSNNSSLNIPRIEAIAKNIAELKKAIPNIIIVSSGAVAAGFRSIGFSSKPKDIIDKQASAAVGQAQLIHTYEQAFLPYNIKVAQILLTKNDLAKRQSHLNVRSTLSRLLSYNIIPIINENDVTIVSELKQLESFGDNDNLSALVAGLIGADMLLILSDVEGLYTADPNKDKNAKIIHHIEYIDEDLLKLAKGSVSGVGTGGMRSKILAAKKALSAGCNVAIIRGLEPDNIARFFKEDNIGSLFSNKNVKAIKKRKLWIAFSATPQGSLIIDNGAMSALLNNKSLLPKGVQEVSGTFNKNDVISIQNLERVEIARGRARYSSLDIAKIKGKPSCDIEAILSFYCGDEVVLKDDIYILN